MRKTVLALSLSCLSAAAFAQVTVGEPWVRGTVAAQKATGAFMELTSSEDAVLVSASSPVAGVVEVHHMAMDQGVMKMRAIPRLDLPAGKTVRLEPGGYHVMLMDLKQQMKAGDVVAITLEIQGKDGKTRTVEVKAAVRALAAAAGHERAHGAKH